MIFKQTTEPFKIEKIEWESGKRYIYGQDSGFKVVSVANKPSQEAIRNASDFLYAKVSELVVS
ncbi:hypothetical protein [Desmospora activa]|uniref:hypothetical protein n=1 Tax=Desmospora activa TaxID=500615 RepID=UPI0011B205EE|nr:hypothetical protein [Desmospora activa]